MFEDMVKAVKKNREIKKERVANFDFAYPYILSRAGPVYTVQYLYKHFKICMYIMYNICNDV